MSFPVPPTQAYMYGWRWLDDGDVDGWLMTVDDGTGGDDAHA
eukprot:CAMPEP_0181365218 /NCGR_PEP_ID=MMETSP1106-20121128/9925_1 /TAXON_ID=81844 /ORGANISM="Mantoniella antarctica, Strain SL-175" /LENGTH=41 /DNA_ID= /DNA_START= /DNA_END= /DNA_ORIENTATION=